MSFLEYLRPRVSLIALFAFGLATTGWAQDKSIKGFTDKISLSTFGGWSFGITDDNLFLDGSPDGEFENVSAGVNLTARFTPKLRAVVQGEVLVDPEETEVELDYGFLAWSINDTFQVKIGRVKHAFGIYSEVFDIGTLRPFPQLPQSIYGPTGIAGENLDGFEVEVSLQLSNGWDLEQSYYWGELEFEALEPWDSLRDEDEGEDGDEGDDEGLFESKARDNVFGARWSLRPNDKLNLGLSAYTGTAIRNEEGEGEIGTDARHTSAGLHIEYLADRWSFRAEFAHLDEEDEVRIDSYYLELAWRWTEHWQLAGMFDASTVAVEEVDTALFSTLERHRDGAVGINYWFSDHLVLKLALHHVDGNRYAIPQEGFEEAAAIDESTRLLQFALQFSF